jgi:long-chain fatty acid transport protein
MKAKKTYSCLVGSILFILGANSGYANGYHFLHQSGEGFGAAYSTNAASINDISAMFSNPSSITRFDGFNLSSGLALDFPRSKFGKLSATAAYTGAKVNGVPSSPKQPIDTAVGGNAYATYQLSDDLYFGLSFTAPYAYVSEYPATSPSRYTATLTKLYAYNLSPTLAWKLSDKVSLGLSLNLQLYQNDVNTMVSTDPTKPDPATDIESRIGGSDFEYGFSLGMEYQVSKNTRFGASYRSQINHKFSVHSDLVGAPQNLDTLKAAVPTLTAFEGSADFSINTPSMLQIGLLHKLSEKWEMYGNANLTGWHAFKDTRISFDYGFPDVAVSNSWNDSWFIAIGAGYQWNEKLKLRAGMAYDWSPTPAAAVSPRAPNNDRMYAATGFSYQANEKWKVDFGYLYILFQEVHVDLAGGNNIPRGTLKGDLNLYANVFMLSFNRSFK